MRTCDAWLLFGFFRGHEMACVCDRQPSHGGDHTGVRDGRRFTWTPYYARWVDGKAVAR